jgi:BTB/POZ domain
VHLIVALVVQEKVQGSNVIKDHLMSLLRSKSLGMRQRMATSLAHLLRPEDISRAYSEHGGAAVLLNMACDVTTASVTPARWESAMAALREVVLVAKKREKDASSSFVPDAPGKKARCCWPLDDSWHDLLAVWYRASFCMRCCCGCAHADTRSAAAAAAATRSALHAQVIIDKSYVNNPRVHDVVFVVEGEPFYAHKLALSASSEAFGAMFESPCREGDLTSGIPSITIPHISRPVFHAMMLFIYTGDPTAVDGVSGAPAPQLLQAADQYLLDKLKVKCAEDLARTLTVENVREQFELAMQFNATKLAHAAVAFCVTEHAEMEGEVDGGRPGYVALLSHIRSILEEYLDAHLWQQLLPDSGAATSGDLPLSRGDAAEAALSD